MKIKPSRSVTWPPDANFKVSGAGAYIFAANYKRHYTSSINSSVGHGRHAQDYGALRPRHPARRPAHAHTDTQEPSAGMSELRGGLQWKMTSPPHLDHRGEESHRHKRVQREQELTKEVQCSLFNPDRLAGAQRPPSSS